MIFAVIENILINNDDDEEDDHQCQGSKGPVPTKGTTDLNFNPSTNPKRPRNSKDHIKRPLNAFMIWSKDQRRTISKTSPHLHHSSISKTLGLQWKSMSVAEKQCYYDQQAELFKTHCL